MLRQTRQVRFSSLTGWEAPEMTPNQDKPEDLNPLMMTADEARDLMANLWEGASPADLLPQFTLDELQAASRRRRSTEAEEDAIMAEIIEREARRPRLLPSPEEGRDDP
jgi:hypothetical protein